MGRYVLTEKKANILKSRDLKLVCKICECPLLIGDEIESKSQRRGKCKLYHAKCYDDSHVDIPNGEELDEYLKTEFGDK